MTSKIQPFDGKGDVKTFLEKVKLYAAIKEYSEEKHAQVLGSNLNSPAFEVYMRLSDEDKKKPDKIRDELLKEFDRGVVNREEAIHLLNTTSIRTSESCSAFSYRLKELVKLAYPDFTAPAMDKISKDYFVKSMSAEMQVALKSVQNYSTKALKETVEDTARLVAGFQ